MNIDTVSETNWNNIELNLQLKLNMFQNVRILHQHYSDAALKLFFF